jgi:hypothetical protein
MMVGGIGVGASYLGVEGIAGERIRGYTSIF